MFSDVYGSSSLLADIRRGSTASTSSSSSSASDASSVSSSCGFVAAPRLEAASDEDDGGVAGTGRRMSTFSGFLLEKRPSLYGSAPRIASSLSADSEAQGISEIVVSKTAAARESSAAAAAAGTIFGGPTMKYLLSGGNPTSLIPKEAKKAFRFRRMTSRSRITSANYATMSAGGPLSLPRLFAALVLLCTVGVLVVPIPASAIRPHTRSYSAHGPMRSHGAAAHHQPHRHEMIEAGHLIPAHYSAGLFNSRLGGGHAHYLDQRRAADRHGGSFRNHHAAVLSKLGSSRRGPEAMHFDYEPSAELESAVSVQDLYPKHTGHDLLAINRGMMALVTAAQTNSSSQTHEDPIQPFTAHPHNRNRYAIHSIGHGGGFHDQGRRPLAQQSAGPAVNSADLSPFARPPPSLAAADLFDPQNVFSQPSGGLPAQPMVGLFDFDAKGLIESFDTGFGGLRGQGYLSHLRSLS